MDIESSGNLIEEMAEYGKIGPPKADRLYKTLLAIRKPGALGKKFEKLWRHSFAEAAVHVDVQVRLTHYRPFSRASLVVEVVGPLKAPSEPQVNQFFLIQAHATSEEARNTLAAAFGKPLLIANAPPVFFIKEWKSVVWVLPNGPKLRSVNIFLDPQIFSAFLTKFGLGLSSLEYLPQLPRLIRYVPGRRTLFRYEGPNTSASSALYIKVYRSSLDKAAKNNLDILGNSINSGTLGFRFPRILAHDKRDHIIVMDEVPGSQLNSIIAAAGPEVFAAVGSALASLHLSEIHPNASWSPEGEVTALGKAMADVKLALPAFGPLIEKLLRVIDRQKANLSWDWEAPIHGNLHSDQILVDDSTNIGIVDWDDLSLGDPLYDIGRLMAHIIFASKQLKADSSKTAQHMDSLLDSYARATNKKIDWNRLRWHIAVALLVRGKISALRPLPPTWIEDIGETLIESHKILQGTSQWISNG